MRTRRPRELAVVLLAVAVSAFLFRGQISTAVMLRGDDLLARGDAAGALSKYRRAITLDPANGAALDRVLFAALQHRSPGTLAEVLNRANAYLSAHPGDAAVLQDRALCRLMLGKRALAAGDLERAAHLSHDAQVAVFAEIARGGR